MFTTLTQKVIAGMVIFWILLAFLAFNATYTVQQNRERLAYITQHTITLTSARSEFVFNMYQAIQKSRDFILSRDIVDRDQALAALDRAEIIMREQLEPLDTDDRSVIGLDPIPQEHINTRTTILAEVNLNVSQTLRNSADNPTATSEQLYTLQQVERALNQYRDATDELVEEEIEAARRATTLAAQRGALITPVSFAVLLIGSIVIVWVIRRSILNPIRRISTATQLVAAGDLNQTLPEDRIDELGTLQSSFNSMVADLRQQRQELQTRAAELENNLGEQQRLFATIKELSTPLLPITNGVVVLPIVGHVDSQRADELTHVLLDGVAQRRARIVIIDVTGIPVMDTQVIQLLLRAAYATQLLGSQVWLAGISPVLAQSLVEHGVDLDDLQSFRDLSAAIAAALQHRTQLH